MEAGPPRTPNVSWQNCRAVPDHSECFAFGLFGFTAYEVRKALPPAKNAPQIGQRAPDFSLVDANGQNFSLVQLLASPITDSGGTARATKGVLVYFYRGYW